MKPIALVAALIVVMAAAPAAAASGPTASAADRACRPAVAGGFIARKLHVQRVSCRSAKTKLRRWLRQDRPLVGRHRGWLCYTEEGLVICSYVRSQGSGVAPNFYFVLRKQQN